MGAHVAGNRLQVVDHPGGGFRVGEDHGSDRLACVRLQGSAEGLRIEGLAPLRLHHLHIQAIGLSHLHPALTELAVVAAEHPVALAQHVDDAGLHRRRAAASDGQHVAAGLVQPLQLGGGAFDDLLEIGAAVADRVAAHRQQDSFRHRCGAGDHQGELVLHGSGGGEGRGDAAAARSTTIKNGVHPCFIPPSTPPL